MEKKIKVPTKTEDTQNNLEICNFLRDVKDPADGINRLIKYCQELPQGMPRILYS